jgi:glycosyltransferase involved in cell wall biosynthesis
VHRPVKFAAHLAARGVEIHVLAPDDPKWVSADSETRVPEAVAVHRARFVGPPARRLGDELFGKRGPGLALAHARHLFPRLLVPDEFVLWVLTAAPAAVRLVRRHGIDVVMTSSSPASVHLVGAAVKRATGVPWIADVRDSLVANPDRRTDRALVRAKQSGERSIALLVARYADAVVAATEAIAGELESIGTAPVTLIRNGCDFEDFAGLTYSAGDRFRLTHTGSFYGERDPRAALRAVAASSANVTVRFAGDFRPRDRAYASDLGLADRIELYGHVPRRRALELQRSSEALLLLVPDAGGRGRGVVPAKLFEYLASGRPILAAVPPDGEAAAIVRETDAGDVVEPDDVDAIRRALAELIDRFEAGGLEPVRLSDEQRARLSRQARVDELEALINRVR